MHTSLYPDSLRTSVPRMDGIIQNCGVEGRLAVKLDHGCTRWKQHDDYASQDHATIIFLHIIMSPPLSIAVYLDQLRSI